MGGVYIWYGDVALVVDMLTVDGLFDFDVMFGQPITSLCSFPPTLCALPSGSLLLSLRLVAAQLQQIDMEIHFACF